MTDSMSVQQSSNSRPRLMFYCQHAKGLGHLVRSTEVLRGLSGFDVTFINAGDGVEGFQLPPTVEVVGLPLLNVDRDFGYSKGSKEAEAVEAVKRDRKERLLSIWQRTQPEILMIELFPFGRKKFEFELVPLLKEILRTAPRTRVVCSLRDILVSKYDQSRWEERVLRLANAYFDLVLIHSDPRFQRFDETFGRVSDLRCEIRYTGFVVQPLRRKGPDAGEALRLPDDGKPVVVASIGGGNIGGELLVCALRASERIRGTTPHHLVAITGPRFPETEWPRVSELAEGRPGITLMRYTGRFLEYLEKADLSVSLAGYNTCMNILTTGVPALVYPVTGYNVDEQIIRSNKLEALGAVSVIRKEELTPEALGGRIQAALRRKEPRRALALDTRGVENTAKILMELTARESRDVNSGFMQRNVEPHLPA